MLTKRWRLAGVVGLVLFLSLVSVGIALATSSVNITGYGPSRTCTGASLMGTNSNDEPLADSHLLVENLTRGTIKELRDENHVGDYSGDCVWCGAINPAGSQPNDIIRYTVSWEDDSFNVLAIDSITVNCSTGEIIEESHASPSKEKEPPYTGIFLLSSAEQAPYLSVPAVDGATACGVFDVNGWGRKYVGLGDFPGCTAPVTVMCFDGAGEWTGDTVGNVVMQGHYEVDFTSSQHGKCGLFER
jgi:hypothetical protein